jgi:hypothetical protein
MLTKYSRAVYRLLYKWLNRRSQRRSTTWKQFARRYPECDLAPPRIVETRPTPALPPATQPA